MFCAHQFINSSTRVDSRGIFSSCSILINSSTHQLELIAEVFFSSCSILINSLTRQFELIAEVFFSSCSILIDSLTRQFELTAAASFLSSSTLINSSTCQLELIAEVPFSSCSKIPPKGSLYGLSIVLVVCIAACSSFVCLSAFCSPCLFDVTCYAFKEKMGKMLHNTQGLSRR